MINPEFLASLRRQRRPELVLLLVQLEQVCPDWWPTLTELAEQLGTDQATLRRSLRQLEGLDLIRRHSVAHAGTWIWWVARHQGDTPKPDDEPAWRVLDREQQQTRRIPLRGWEEWGRRRGIPRQTMRSWLTGNQRLLRGRWEVRATPLDREDM